MDTSFNGTVTVKLASNPGGATLGGTLTAMATDGVATFSDLTLDKAATGYALRIFGQSVLDVVTSPFDVTPATATELLVTDQPSSSLMAGSGFGLTVVAKDAFGNTDTNFAGRVTVALAGGPGGATLSGSLSELARSGVLTFSDLRLDQPGIGYSLRAAADGLTSATTDAFDVLTSVGSSIGVNWGTAGEARLDTSADGLRLLPAGRNTDLPWLGISQIEINLAQAATLSPSDITVLGSSGINFGPVTLSGSGTSYTITLAQAINGPQQVTITIANPLIVNFTRRLVVMPGDYNDDGVVDAQDMLGVRNEMLGLTATADPLRRHQRRRGVDINDYNAVRRLIGTHW